MPACTSAKAFFKCAKNTSNRVRIPINGYNLGISRYYDNMLATSRVGAYFLNCQTQAFRNNDFVDYWTGINAEGTIVSLTSLHEAGPATPIQAYGRNRFAVVDPALFQPNGQGHPNPYIANWAQDVAFLTDLQYNIGAQYLIRCGYNAFSDFATWHLSAPWMPVVNVDGTNNNFRPIALPRGNNVNVGGNPWNVSQGYQQFCGIQYDAQSCTIFNLNGSSNQPPGKQILDENEAIGSIHDGEKRMATYVFEQATTTIDGLRGAIHAACGGLPVVASFEVHAVTGQSHSLSELMELHIHMQKATPGVYSLRVVDKETGSCSVLILIIR